MIALILFISSLSAASLDVTRVWLETGERWLKGEKATSRLDSEVYELLNQSRVEKAFFKKRLQRLRLRPRPPIAVAERVIPFGINLQAIKLEVLNPEDDVTKDDVYLYFFISDGHQTIGKVTDIYRGLARDESILFKSADRLLYPLDGTRTHQPSGYFLVDYGLVESDGDDVRELKKLTALIIDLTALILAATQPEQGELLIRLRAEVKNLADALLSGEHDDELVASTWELTELELTQLSEKGYVNIWRKHGRDHMFGSWKYRLNLRLQL